MIRRNSGGREAVVMICPRMGNTASGAMGRPGTRDVQLPAATTTFGASSRPVLDPNPPDDRACDEARTRALGGHSDGRQEETRIDLGFVG